MNYISNEKDEKRFAKKVFFRCASAHFDKRNLNRDNNVAPCVKPYSNVTTTLSNEERNHHDFRIENICFECVNENEEKLASLKEIKKPITRDNDMNENSFEWW